jgi:hypothetical protein
MIVLARKRNPKLSRSYTPWKMSFRALPGNDTDSTTCAEMVDINDQGDCVEIADLVRNAYELPGQKSIVSSCPAVDSARSGRDGVPQ